MMRQQVGYLDVQTHGQGLILLNIDLSSWVLNTGIVNGLLTLWCKHTSASFIVQENVDPNVREDIMRFLNELVPENRQYLHNTEGPDDMPAHIKSILTQTQLSIPVVDRQITFGVWQGVYLFEHRKHPYNREIVMHIMGE